MTQHTRAIGLATGLATAVPFATASTLFTPTKSMAHRSKNPGPWNSSSRGSLRNLSTTLGQLKNMPNDSIGRAMAQP